MKVALTVNRVTADSERNLENILDSVAQASCAGADLVLFAETALTGLINNGDLRHDLPLGRNIPGPETDRVCKAAKKHGIYVALGLFEREGDSLYDSAILAAPDGRIAMKYRRISKGWRGLRWDPSVYREGQALERVDTPLGSMAFMICGDLFDDDLCERVRQMGVDYLLYPMARIYTGDAYDQAKWDSETRAEYISRVAPIGATLLLVNGLGGGFEPDAGDEFGGAMAVAKDGRVLVEMPLGRAGLLVVDV